MKINIIKNHHQYPLGEVDVDEDRARYLIGVGVAEGLRYEEKVEQPKAKEKKENKTGNVPTAKKKSK